MMDATNRDRRRPSLIGALTTLLVSLPGVAQSGDADAYSDGQANVFATCKLGEVKGASMSIKSYACGADFSNARLVADDALPGFVELSDGADGEIRTVRIRAFKKPADAPVDAVLAAVRAASPGPATDTCVLEAVPAGDQPGRQAFTLSPTGDAKSKWEAGGDNGDPGDPPCGALGVQIAGDLFFQLLPGDPSTVVFVDAGSEIQIFDLSTLKSASGN